MNSEIEALDENNLEEVLGILSKIPLETLTLLADSTQLSDWCDVRILREGGKIEGIFSLYRDLDFLAGAFWCDSTGDSTARLKILIDDYGDELRDVEVVFIATEQQLECLKKISKSVNAIPERQMNAGRTTELVGWGDGTPEKLTKKDSEELRTLYKLSGTPAWTPNALDLGPFYGIRNSEGKIVSVAGVHYLTPCCAEIGNIATHPEYRKKGFASRCTIAVAEDLFEQVPLVVIHFFEDNTPAQRLYERMGFEYTEVDPIYFVKAIL